MVSYSYQDAGTLAGGMPCPMSFVVGVWWSAEYDCGVIAEPRARLAEHSWMLVLLQFR